jgi:hypothetical protein
VKLSANWCNAVSIAMVPGGILAPIVLWYSDPQKIEPRLPYVLIGFFVWILLAAGLHFLAQALLRRLR